MHSDGAGGALKSLTLQLHKISKHAADYCALPYGASGRGRCATRTTSGSQQVVCSNPLLFLYAFAPVTRIVAGRTKLTFFSPAESYCTFRCTLRIWITMPAATSWTHSAAIEVKLCGSATTWLTDQKIFARLFLSPFFPSESTQFYATGG